jgi:AraC-like DNA-binding protein
LSFAPAVLADAFAAYDPSVLDHPEEPFRASWAPFQSSTALLLHRFRTAVRNARAMDPALNKLALDESALWLLDAVARDAAGFGKRAKRHERHDTHRAHRALAEDTRAVLSEDISAPLPLAVIARRVRSSPFHLARVFRRRAGLPIHKYLARLRLRVALQRLAEGESDLTRLAFSVGFSSHSHFSDAFRREFGHSPSSIRSELTAACDFETSKNLKA